MLNITLLVGTVKRRRTKNAKAFHDKCENMTLSDFYQAKQPPI
ncbi:hypothetical protein ABLN73_01630 [Mycobacterium tuberculosis]